MKSLLQSLSQLILPHPSAVPPESCGVVVVLQLTLSSLSADIDMKKDIETLIAEERADIILKYATVRTGSFIKLQDLIQFTPDGYESGGYIILYILLALDPTLPSATP